MRFQFLLLIIFLALGIYRVQAQPFFPEFKGKLQYHGAVPYRDSTKWGLADAGGKILVAPAFGEVVILSPDLFAAYPRSGFYECTLFNGSGKRIRGLRLNGHHPFLTAAILKSIPADTTIRIRTDTGWWVTRSPTFLIDLKGRPVGDERGYLGDVQTFGRFIKVAQVQHGRLLYGLLDTFGRALTPIRYRAILPFGYEALLIREEVGTTYASFPGGREHAWPFPYSDTSLVYFGNGYFLRKESNALGAALFRYDGRMLDTLSKGDELRPVDPAHPGSFFYHIVRTAGGERRYGLLNGEGKSLLPPLYLDLRYMGGRLFAAQADNGEPQALYDAAAGRFIPGADHFDEIGVGYREGYVYGKKGDTTTVLDSLGQLLFTCRSTPNLAGDTWYYGDPGMSAFINPVTRDTFRCEVWNRVHTGPDRHLQEFKINGKYGVFDIPYWKPVIPPLYQKIEGSASSIIMAIGDTFTHLYTTAGRRLLPQYNGTLLRICGPYLLVLTKDQAIVADTTGKVWLTRPAGEGGGYALTDNGLLLQEQEDDVTEVTDIRSGRSERIKGTFETGDCNQYYCHEFCDAAVRYLNLYNEGKTGLFDKVQVKVVVPPVFGNDIVYRPTRFPGLFLAGARGKFLGYFTANGRKFWKD